MTFHSILFKNTEDCLKNETIDAPDFFVDLNLDQIIDAITASKQEYNLKPFFYTSLPNVEAICYRHEVMQDMGDETLMAHIKAFAEKMVIVRRYLALVEKLDYNYHQKGWFLEAALVYCEAITNLACDLSQTNLQSYGFFAMIQQELDDDYLAVVEEHLKALKFRCGVLISAQLGKGNEGANYVLRQPNPDDRLWLKRLFVPKLTTYSFSLHPRDDHGARALGDLRERGLNRVANAVAQSADHIESFLNALRVELAFYIGCLNLAERLAQLGEPIAFPKPTPADERRLCCTSLYDIALALAMEQKVVSNDVAADGKELVIITGANQGGKSTFLRSIGLAQLMMQCGMFVPAESFSANVCNGLVTHYKREEDATMESGKFDEELSRLSEIVDHVTANSMVLFNESFAATNEREGSEIARQIVSALLEQHIKVFFVTHLYEFASNFYDKKMGNAMFLRAERQADGRRTFKLIEREPLPTSYGADLYEKIFGSDH